MTILLSATRRGILRLCFPILSVCPLLAFGDRQAPDIHLPAELPGTRLSPEVTLSGIGFSQPVQVIQAPGDDDHFFVVERHGAIRVFPADSPEANWIMIDLSDRIQNFDVERGLFSAAFHPDFPDQPYLFVYHTTVDSTEQGDGGHRTLSRYEISESDYIANPGSGVDLIHQFDPSHEHKGGTLRFGPDGYLYLGLGDGGWGPHEQNAQQITRGFFGAVIRLDVDERAENLPPNDHPASVGNYRVPADNPYVGATEFNGEPVDPGNVRTEFWAVGFRNPFRMQFDPQHGGLWVADVGGNAYEELNYVEAGKNYGWPFFEGPDRTSFFRDPPEGVDFEPPVWGYDHSVGQTIIVGGPYFGSEFPQMSGKMLVGDFSSGQIWAFDPDPENIDPQLVVNGVLGYTDYVTDPRDGGLLITNLNNWRMERLTREEGGDAELPELLSETGAFRNLATLQTSPGIGFYDINVPFWSDYAEKWRWFAVPEGETIDFEPESAWTFPTGTTWIKHFELETVRGDPSSRIRLETRFIVKTEDSVYGITYRWNDAGTDATLVPAEGLTEEIQVVDEDGQAYTQTWDYPSRSACMACHTPKGGYALGFNTAQLNRPGGAGAPNENQLRQLEEAGYFSEPLPYVHALPQLTAATDESASLTHRVRSYFEANCVSCHQPGGSALGRWDARIGTPAHASNLIGANTVRPSQNPDDKVITPGSPEKSALFQRLTGESGRMPPLATYELDEEAIELLRRWIEEEAPEIRTYEQWSESMFSQSGPDMAPDADPDLDGSTNYSEFVLGSDPRDASSAFAPQFSRVPHGYQLSFNLPANTSFRVWENTDNLQGEWALLDLPDARLEFPPEPEQYEVFIPSNPDGRRFFFVEPVAP